jgi:hypothetical protein
MRAQALVVWRIPIVNLTSEGVSRGFTLEIVVYQRNVELADENPPTLGQRCRRVRGADRLLVSGVRARNGIGEKAFSSIKMHCRTWR